MPNLLIKPSETLGLMVLQRFCKRLAQTQRICLALRYNRKGLINAVMAQRRGGAALHNYAPTKKRPTSARYAAILQKYGKNIFKNIFKKKFIRCLRLQFNFSERYGAGVFMFACLPFFYRGGLGGGAAGRGLAAAIRLLGAYCVPRRSFAERL
jgi:hypothetical protein